MPTSFDHPPAIRAEGLGKRYRIGAPHDQGDLVVAMERLVGAPRRVWARLRGRGASPHAVWALRELDLEVGAGEVLGLVGNNGAGKTTLLKLLALITEPTEGRFTLRGRTASLLEIGTGFHMELTGRENVFLAGTILGMRRREIRRRFDEIIEFAGIGRYIDTPIKRYSTGMYMRLGFAVAAHLDAEILLVDEVLAVADAAFRERCIGTMSSAAESGRTVVFVSHDMGSIQKLCTRAVLLDGGRLVKEGSPKDIVSHYLRVEERPAYRVPGDRTGKPQLLAVELRTTSGASLARPSAPDPLAIHVRWAQAPPVFVESLEVTALTQDGTVLFSTVSSQVEKRLPTAPGDYEGRVVLPGGTLLPGSYHLAAALIDAKGRALERREPALAFRVAPGAPAVGTPPRGSLRIDCEWEVPDGPAAGEV